MAESMNSLFRRGMISEKQMGRMEKPAILRQTKPGVPTKMAKFEHKRKDEGSKDRGEIPPTEINHPTNQRLGKIGTVSKGGQVGKGAQPTVNAINQDQTPKFPAGDRIKANRRQVGVKGHGGKSSGPEYGGPSSRADG
jgi:hypothetical protein